MNTIALCAVTLFVVAPSCIASANDLTAHDTATDAVSGAKAEAAAAAEKSSRSGAREYFTDVQLVDQYGNEQRLYTDLLKDRVVVLSSFFTNCEDSCPIVAAKFAALQEGLGERLDSQVRLILVTTDPLRDTPDVLNSYADTFKARPGWFFLTGDKSDVDFTLQRFGHNAPTPEAHKNVIIIMNDATGPERWDRARAIVSVRDLLQRVESQLADAES